jgi:hypothetical protein
MTTFTPVRTTIFDPADVWLGMILDTIDAIARQRGHPPVPRNIQSMLLSLAIKGTVNGTRYDATGLTSFYDALDKPWIVAPPALDFRDPDLTAWPPDRVRKIKGAMWTCQGPVPIYGPRPGQPSNIVAMDYVDLMPDDVAMMMIRTYSEARYSHSVMGPIVDAGYRGQWPASTIEDWDRYLDMTARLLSSGVCPVHFLVPDGWTLDRVRRELEPLYRSPRAQRLMLYVCLAWEPARYERSNLTWRRWLEWQANVFPNAFRAVHTAPDIDALTGVDEAQNDEIVLNGDWGKAWSNVASLIHAWFVQNSAFEHPDALDNEGHTAFENFVAQFDDHEPNWRRTLVRRFREGLGGWPKFSAYGADTPIDVVAAEFASSWVYHNSRSVREAQTWGDAALRAGASGCLDGCTIDPR